MRASQCSLVRTPRAVGVLERGGEARGRLLARSGAQAITLPSSES